MSNLKEHEKEVLEEKAKERDEFILSSMKDAFERDANFLDHRDEDLVLIYNNFKEQLVRIEGMMFRKIIAVRNAKENSKDTESVQICIAETEEYEMMVKNRKEILETIKYIRKLMERIPAKTE